MLRSAPAERGMPPPEGDFERVDGRQVPPSRWSSSEVKPAGSPIGRRTVPPCDLALGSGIPGAWERDCCEDSPAAGCEGAADEGSSLIRPDLGERRSPCVARSEVVSRIPVMLR